MYIYVHFNDRIDFLKKREEVISIVLSNKSGAVIENDDIDNNNKLVI